MPVEFKDYYETLGVARTATADEIKKAFRKLARIHHPDVAKNKAQGEKKFKEINEAYEVLGDPDKRQKYDQLGANWDKPEFHAGQGGPGFGGFRQRGGGFEEGGIPFEFNGTGFSDFFEQFFAGARPGATEFRPRGGRPGRSTTPIHGDDVEADILVTLEEALKGMTRQVTVRRQNEFGEAGKTDTYKVKIPAGVHEGKRIRLAGQGGAGLNGGPAGDLYLRVRLAKHPEFHVEGDHLFYDIELAPWEAVLGKKIEIKTLDGSANIHIKPGTQAGTTLRLRGLGLPTEGGKRGDLYVKVVIEVPESVSDSEKALWEQLAAKSEFNPRD